MSQPFLLAALPLPPTEEEEEPPPGTLLGQRSPLAPPALAFDDQTPESTKELTDRLRAGEPVTPTRGPSRVCTFKQVSRVLAGFPDGLADEGPGAGEPSLRGTLLAKERGWTAPRPEPETDTEATEAGASGGQAAGAHDSVNTGANEADEVPTSEGVKDVDGDTTTEGEDS